MFEIMSRNQRTSGSCSTLEQTPAGQLSIGHQIHSTLAHSP